MGSPFASIRIATVRSSAMIATGLLKSSFGARQDPTQVIYTISPQAKGCIERLFGPLQEWLIAELQNEIWKRLISFPKAFCEPTKGNSAKTLINPIKPGVPCLTGSISIWSVVS